MFPERMVSRECGYCGLFRSDLVRCTKCKVAAYCSNKAMDMHKEGHEVQCESICKLIQSYRKGLQGPEGELIFDRQRRAQKINSKGFPVEVIEYMFAYFCTRYLFGRGMTLYMISEELNRFSNLISMYKWTVKTGRRTIPTELLSHGKDEMCYDFIKESLRSQIREDMPRSAVEAGLGYRDRNNKDPFDDDNFFLMDGIDPWDPNTEMILSVALIFLKVKIIVDLQALEAFTEGMKARTKVPKEILTRIKYFAASSCYVERSLHLLEEDPRKAIDVLTKQVEKLFVEVDQFNRALWPFLIYNISPWERDTVGYNDPGPIFEVIYDSSELWEHNPQILQFVAEMMKRLSRHNYQRYTIRGM